MPSLFADTSGLGNLIDPTPPHHALAAEVYRTARQQYRRVVTTNYILTELVALLTSPLRIPRPLVIEFIDGLVASPFMEIVHIDPTLNEQAWHLLKSRPDKEWSLVDCASFVVMQQRGLTEALTTDHHFEQAGFVRLLKPR
jgi:predicted nucleic acid-binding protein